jgi:hypothetical protein
VNKTNKSAIYFHVGTIGKYQEIFDEIYFEIKESGLLNEVESLTIGIVGSGKLKIEENDKIKVYTNPNLELGEFFTLDLLKKFSDTTIENYKILYLHTKGVTAPNNPCIEDWRQYMTYFNVIQHQKCFDVLDEYDCCGVDLVSEPALHYSGTFWWANSSYIKKLPIIDEIRFPKTPPILSSLYEKSPVLNMFNQVSLETFISANMVAFSAHHSARSLTSLNTGEFGEPSLVFSHN